MHVFIEVQGYFSGNSTSDEGSFRTEPATAVFHTGTAGVLQPGETRSFSVSSGTGVPEYGAEAVAVNVTTWDVQSTGNLKLYAKGTTPSATPLMAFSANEPTGFSVGTIVPVGLDGSLTVTNTSTTGTLNLQVRLQGWFSGYRAVPVSQEPAFLNSADRFGVPANVAKLAVWRKELADTVPQDVDLTSTPPAQSEIDNSAPLTSDDPQVDTTSSPVISDPIHEEGTTTGGSDTDAPASATPPALRDAESGTCRSGYRMREAKEYLMIKNKTNINLYWMSLRKRFCVRPSAAKIDSVYTHTGANVMAWADPWITYTGLDDSGRQDYFMKADGRHSQSGHYSQRVHVFKYCAIKVAICYNTEFGQGASVFWNYNMYSNTWKW